MPAEPFSFFFFFQHLLTVSVFVRRGRGVDKKVDVEYRQLNCCGKYDLRLENFIPLEFDSCFACISFKG